MQIKNFLLTSALYLSLAGGAVPAVAEDARSDTKYAEGRSYSVGDDRLRFTLQERAVIQQFVQDSRQQHSAGGQKALPPGLQKKVAAGKRLPPGWQKKLALGGVLPAPVYAAGVRLPADLTAHLPPAPQGTVTIELDGEVVRVIEDTLQIVDILTSPH